MTPNFVVTSRANGLRRVKISTKPHRVVVVELVFIVSSVCSRPFVLVRLFVVSVFSFPMAVTTAAIALVLGELICEIDGKFFDFI